MVVSGSAMVICPKCQLGNDDGTAFCWQCGAALQRSTPPWKGRIKWFAAGFATGVAVPILGLIAVIFWPSPTSPLLDVRVEIPVIAELEESFTIQVIAHNPYPEASQLDNITIYDPFFETFEVLSVIPTPTEDSPARGVGSSTFPGSAKIWYFYLDIPPSATEKAVFEVSPLTRGRQIIKLEVCNASEDCILVVRGIDIE